MTRELGALTGQRRGQDLVVVAAASLGALTPLGAPDDRHRAVLVEALFALLALPVVFAASIVMSLIVAHLFGGTGSPTVPWGPLAGSFNPLEFECQTLHIGETGQRLIVYCAAAGSATQAAFRRLAQEAQSVSR